MGLIWLCGISGAGKSTVGRLLARRLEVPFFDSDEQVERNAQRSVSEIFRDGGESEFREREAEAVTQIAQRPDGVVSLGAGALERDATFRLVRSAGVLVYLAVRPQAAMRRLWPAGDRPLLQGAGSPVRLQGRLRDLLTRRETRYRSADIVIEADEKSPAAIVEELVPKLGYR